MRGGQYPDTGRWVRLSTTFAAGHEDWPDPYHRPAEPGRKQLLPPHTPGQSGARLGHVRPVRPACNTFWMPGSVPPSIPLSDGLQESGG